MKSFPELLGNDASVTEQLPNPRLLLFAYSGMTRTVHIQSQLQFNPLGSCHR